MNTPTQNLKLAQAFLKLLDPTATSFCFRTFDDTGAKRGQLARNFCGSIETLFENLAELNCAGAGVFVVVNDGGQKRDEITRVRAVFADTDGAPLEPIVNALQPSFIINTSPGKWHVYWRVTPDFPVEQFGPVQKAIAEKFGTDGSVFDLSRVMRVPGFNHNKTAPFAVSIVEWARSLKAYSFAEILSSLELASAAAPPSPPSGQRSLALTNAIAGGGITDLAEVETLLHFINPWRHRQEWMPVCFALADEYGEPARDLFVRWSRGDLWDGGRHGTA